VLSSISRKEMGRNGRSAHFFLDYSNSSWTLVRRHTGAHCKLPQKVMVGSLAVLCHGI